MTLLLGYGDRFVFPDVAVAALTRAYWLAGLWTVVVVTPAVRHWTQGRGSLAGRVHYSLVALAAVLFVWFLVSWNLLASI